MVSADFFFPPTSLQFVLLGAVPFPSDVPRLKQLGVHGVVTLNEPYETLVPTSLYQVKFMFLPNSMAYWTLLFKLCNNL